MAELLRGDIEAQKVVVENEETYPETGLINKKLEWFQDQKLGVIFHWGLYAEAGIVESWQLSEQDEWAREPEAWRDNMADLQRDYWGLIESFNPVNFDAKKLAKDCKEAGFKYMIFTTKHHDGFHMWNTKLSEYKIGGKLSPSKRDLYGEVVEAFRAEGLGIGTYYSKADWYSPFYWSNSDTIKGRRADYDTAENPELWNKYVEFVHEELEELTQNYGPVDILWLDGGWCGQGKEDLRMDEMAQKVRKTNPDLLIVDRMMGGRHENYVTPERKIPDVAEIPNKPWESNIPIADDWGYTPDDDYKSSRDLMIHVIDVVSKGGNIILGFGPDGKGDIPVKSQQFLTDLKGFMSQFSEGIYDTRALKYQMDNRRWYVTQKEDVLFAFYPFETKTTTVILPEAVIEGREVKQIQVLNQGDEVRFTKVEEGYEISLDETAFDWQIAGFKLFF